MIQDLGVWLAVGMAQDAVAVAQVTVEFHVTYGCEAVEPRIGHRLHNLPEAGAPDLFFQTLARFRHSAGEGVRANHGHIALFYNLFHASCSQAVRRRPCGHRRDEIAPRFLGIDFKCVAIHGVLAPT